MPTIKALCHIDDIPEQDSRGLEWQGRSFIAVREQGRLFLYDNRCPHIGVPLHWRPNEFLTPDKSLIQCATHGALFSIDSGECLAGPCQGQHLTAVEYRIDDGWVYPDTPPPTQAPDKTHQC